MHRREFLLAAPALASASSAVGSADLAIWPADPFSPAPDGRKTLFGDAFDRALRASQFRPLPTGFVDLDAFLVMPPESGMITIAARPAMGSTALALQFAMAAAEYTGRPILVASLDDSAVTMAIRAANLLDVGQDEQPKLDTIHPRRRGIVATRSRRMTRLRERGFVIRDSLELASEGLRESLLRIRNRYGSAPAVTLVDRADLLRANGIGPRKGNADSPTGRAQWLAGLSEQFGTHILATARVDKRLEERDNKRPRLADLTPESFALAQASDATLFVYRDEVYSDSSDERGLGNVIVVANRWGLLGTMFLQFNRGRWSDYGAPG